MIFLLPALAVALDTAAVVSSVLMTSTGAVGAAIATGATAIGGAVGAEATAVAMSAGLEAASAAYVGASAGGLTTTAINVGLMDTCKNLATSKKPADS